MIQLQSGDDRVIRIIQKNNPRHDRVYRLSQWVYSFEKDGEAVLRSTLSGQAYRLSAEEWSAVRGGNLSSPAAEELAKQRFLVEQDFDDLAQYAMVKAVLQSMEKRERGAKIFTILPTTGCNARCVYCYQQGIAVRNMTAETAERVVEFISREKRQGIVELHWFGGEPLCAAGTISGICRRLREKNVEYKSSITTNGSLFTPELIREAVELWNLKKAQVSMDGAKEDYETRKRYIRPDLHNYEVVMDNVERLAAAGVSIVIRCNCDSRNASRAYGFLDECEARFGSYDNVRVSPAILNQEWTEWENSFAASEEQKKLRSYAVELGLAHRRTIPVRLKTHQCMADAGGRNIIIDPDGGLHVCEDRVGGEPLGSIFDAEPPSWPTAPVEPAEECRDCCFLPVCTTHYRKGCPLCPAACRELTERAMREELEAMFDGTTESASGAEDAEDAEDAPCQ